MKTLRSLWTSFKILFFSIMGLWCAYNVITGYDPFLNMYALLATLCCFLIVAATIATDVMRLD